jgi:5-methylcytosine-specific restriction protein A
MPNRTKKQCIHHGCPALVTYPDRYCPWHKKEAAQQKDEGRLTATQRGYGARWHKASRLFLALSPLCVECFKKGREVAATVVDHKIPHKGNMDLFWDENNWQSLCTPCHNRKTVKEDGGFGNRKKG